MTDISAQTPDCHFVTVAEILSDHKGSFADYVAATSARNVIITMEVAMSVAGKSARRYGAALAVSHDFSDADELSNLARQLFHKKTPFAFGWVPANFYGTDKFGIFIEQGDLGELLANGLIDDIIQSVDVEGAIIG